MKGVSLMCVGYRRTPGERRRTRRAGATAAAGAESRRGAMRGLAGKRVVVTGGTSGIGAATAQRFRDEGSEVVVLARTPGYGVIPCDVGHREQVDAAFEQVGDLDVLVNNAGVSVRSPAMDISPDQWDQVLATNLSGAFWVAQAAARRMLLGAGGVILNTASTNALVGYRYYAVYYDTKGGPGDLRDRGVLHVRQPRDLGQE